MRSRKLYKSYLREYPNSSTFYIDPNGVLQTTNMPTCLKNTPAGWWDNQVTLDRSDHYKGVGRKFSNEVRFYGDGAQIIRELTYKYRGVEQLVELVILKWDPDTDAYYLWYRGLLDLKTKQNTIDGFIVSTAEGGAVQMLKVSENRMFEFPCDGSLKVPMPDGSVIRNVKVKLDGMRVQDTFHYVIPPFTASFPGDAVLPASFVSNDGDNVGIIKGNPTYEQPTDPTYFQRPNYVLGTVAPLKMQITGNITIQSDGNMKNTVFRMYARSNLSAPRGTDGIDHAVGLVGYGNPATDPSQQIWFPSNNPVVNGTRTFDFDVTYDVTGNENPFILFFNQSSAHPIRILGGTFSVTFTSQYQTTTCWGIRAYDAWRLLMLNACLVTSTSVQRYSFAGVSKFLQQYPGLVLTSGDAIRASGDPNFRKFYNRIQTNPANPAFQFFNFYNSIGPVLKTSISDFFDDMDARLNCSLGNQVLPADGAETIFLEDLGYVFDSSTVTFALPEVTDVKFSYADEFFGTVKFGQQDQKYDEKAGKFEWNSTSWWAAPIRTETKIKEKLGKYRWDAYGIEYTRANLTQDAKSSTYNGSDNAVFGLSSDVTRQSFDQDVASFLATPLGSGDALNGNQKPIPGQAEQGISLPSLIQTYLRPSNDPSVFIFNQPSGIPGTAKYSWTVIPAGLPGDTVTIIIYYLGLVFATRTYTITTAGQSFTDSITLTESFEAGDCLYAKVATSATCQASITAFKLQVGDGSYFTATIAASQEIQQGNPGQLIPLAIQSGTLFGSSPNQYFGMSYNLPLLVFNEVLSDPGFTIAFQAAGIQKGGGGEHFTVKLWINGQVVGSQTFTGTGSFVNWSTSLANFPVITRNMVFGDQIWVTISPTGGMTAEVGNTTTGLQTPTSITLTSTQIEVFDLLRVQYDAISGIPCLLGNLPDGRPITTGAGAPFNIEPFFTPKRQMMQHKNWMAATLYNLAPDKVQFLQHEKNEFLSTTLNGVTITENTDVAVQDYGTPLYYPIWMEFKTRVKVDLVRLQSYVANGHISAPWIGKTFYGFPWSITQKPSVDEPQTWKILLSPKTNLANLIDMNYDGLAPTLEKLMANQFSFSKIQPFEFVPYGQTPNPAYQFRHLDTDLFINRVQFWTFKRNYFQKARLADRFPLQCMTNGLTVVPLNIYSVRSQPNPSLPPLVKLEATVNMTQVGSSPLKPPYIQLEATICFQDLGLPEGPIYYILPANELAANVAVCEPVKPVSSYPLNQPTLFFEYTNSVNKQSTVFSTGFRSAFRVDGWIDQFSQEGNFTTFEDQPADLELENAVPYETYVLNIGCADGIPDWVFRKVGRIMLLDTVLIDGKAFTREKDAKWEKKTSDSWPKGWYSLVIRPAFNDDALTFGEDGSLLTNTIVTASIDLSAFGNNPAAGPVIIQVTES